MLVFGVGRFGSRLAHGLHAEGVQVLGVDFDPEIIENARDLPYRVCYGDAANSDFFESLPLHHVHWVVSTLPDVEVNLVLMHALREHGYQGKVAAVAHTEREGRNLEELGFDQVFYPYLDAADFAAEVISEQFSR